MVTTVKLKCVLCSHTETVNNIILEVTNKLNMTSFDVGFDESHCNIVKRENIAFMLLITLVSLLNFNSTDDAVILQNVTEPPKHAS